ncbi:polysaccharide pyruvyl transferase family protein [Arcticibacterium luteifluviistationis]|uniref:Polysaccharide pyruvyl transferase family protein n=1 Tax=Arcticibacterium luteifluviistationis TaxID=1784714 RepID=A0A2Z4GBR9_9BACT|nr:polysaccharide pyruvyl transferase family protein [Arcticibacterium luteifluviistationis]AWV98518.1 polysaccharide pyruvyl transferase family protein [Arcticibacterium luteifluviistationis]
MQTRRDFIIQTPSIIGLILGINACSFDDKAKKRILLRSSWQTVNIGDIGHTPGVLALLEKYLPDVEVRLWASDVGNGVREMLLNRFPGLEIFTREDEVSLERAYKECDFFLHGSGPYLVVANDVEDWAEKTGKPYGVFGITYNEVNMSPKVNALLTNAEFVLFRDSFSLGYAKEIGVNSKVMSFGPDGAFAADVKNDEAANAFLSSHGLEKGKFMCVIPKYRYTPYWLIPSKNRALDVERDAVNQANKEHDHLQLRKAIIALVEQTEMKVLIVPEDETQVAIGKEMLYDPLPENIKKNVVWRDKYWLTDEALSTYAQSAGIFGNEQHSPIMCIGMGIPAIVCRWEQQTSKGIMWRDIGLGDWLFDMDNEAEVAGIVPAVLAIAQNNEEAKAKALKAKMVVESYQKENLKLLESEIEKLP